jgi:hypothetical protein
VSVFAGITGLCRMLSMGVGGLCRGRWGSLPPGEMPARELDLDVDGRELRCAAGAGGLIVRPRCRWSAVGRLGASRGNLVCSRGPTSMRLFLPASTLG